MSAYLCVGYVSEFKETPDLARAGWRHRLPLEELLFEDRWGQPAPSLRAELAAVDEDDP